MQTNCKFSNKERGNVLENEKQVLGLWFVVHTNCVDQKQFAKQGLDLDQKTLEDHKIKIVVQKVDVKDKKKRLEHRYKAIYET